MPEDKLTSWEETSKAKARAKSKIILYVLIFCFCLGCLPTSRILVCQGARVVLSRAQPNAGEKCEVGSIRLLIQGLDISPTIGFPPSLSKLIFFRALAAKVDGIGSISLGLNAISASWITSKLCPIPSRLQVFFSRELRCHSFYNYCTVQFPAILYHPNLTLKSPICPVTSVNKAEGAFPSGPRAEALNKVSKRRTGQG